MISAEYLNSLFKYVDGDLYWKKYRSGISESFRAGTIGKHGYCHIKIEGNTYKAHRLIFLMHHGYLPKMIDHINGIKHDNRIENLRECTNSQNAMNSVIKQNNKSGIKGVCWNEYSKKWKVSIAINKVQKHIGYYDDIELAELVAQEARALYHSEFARDA